MKKQSEEQTENTVEEHRQDGEPTPAEPEEDTASDDYGDFKYLKHRKRKRKRSGHSSHHHHHHHHHSGDSEHHHSHHGESSEQAEQAEQDGEAEDNTVYFSTRGGEHSHHSHHSHHHSHHHHHHHHHHHSGDSEHHHSHHSESSEQAEQTQAQAEQNGEAEDNTVYFSTRGGQQSHHHHHHHHHHSDEGDGDNTVYVSSGRKKRRSRHHHHKGHGDEADNQLFYSTRDSHKKKRRKKKKKMKTWKKVLLIVVCSLLALIIALGSVFFVLKNKGQGELLVDSVNVSVPQTVDAEVRDQGDYIDYKGHTYKYNKNITSLLFMGVDKRSLDDDNVEGTGGQADVIVMMALDMKSHKLSMVAVPRDTNAEMELYTPDHHFNGRTKLPLCDAYAYGDGKDTSCVNMVTSVRQIFYNVPVKTYYALDLDGIAAVNDSVGGVDVVSPETIGEFVEGESYHLMGMQAENYVRDRDKTRVDSAMLRLERQKVYAKSFMSTMMSSIKKDFTSAVRVFNESAPYSCTNLNVAKVSYLASELALGGSLRTEMLTVAGKVSDDGGQARFDIDEEKFFEQFLSVYYIKVK